MGFQMFASPPQTAHAAVLCQIDTAIVNMLTAKYIDQQKGPVFQLSLNQRNHLQEKKKRYSERWSMMGKAEGRAQEMG